jgi:hypothetical protein
VHQERRKNALATEGEPMQQRPSDSARAVDDDIGVLVSGGELVWVQRETLQG